MRTTKKQAPVITTGFEPQSDIRTGSNSDTKTVFDLETTKQIGLFNSHGENDFDDNLEPVPVLKDDSFQDEREDSLDEEFAKGHFFDFTGEKPGHEDEDDG